MLKFLTFILSLSIGLFAADLNLKPVKTELLKVEDIYGYIKDSSDIKLNSS
ncbi:exporting protein, partial [Campylobacter coli]|nr:exporting protein [Campylobacter coli]